MYFCGIFLKLKKDISVTIHHPFFFFFFVTTDVTLNESESYFPVPYLKGNSFKEDKERDSYFFDQFLIDPPKVTSPVPVPSTSPFASELESAPIDLVTELKLSPTKPAENRMTGKAYSRKKAAIPRLIQVQESKSASRNEVTVSPPPLQTEYELLIAIRKGMRECTKYPLHPLSHVSIKKLSWSY